MRSLACYIALAFYWQWVSEQMGLQFALIQIKWRGLIPDECQIPSALITYKATTWHLAWWTLKRRHGHSFLATSSSPAFHLYLSIAGTSPPGNSTWTLWPQLFFCGTANKHVTARSFLANQIIIIIFNFDFSYSRRNIFFTLKENKKTWHI